MVNGLRPRRLFAATGGAFAGLVLISMGHLAERPTPHELLHAAETVGCSTFQLKHSAFTRSNLVVSESVGAQFADKPTVEDSTAAELRNARRTGWRVVATSGGGFELTREHMALYVTLVAHDDAGERVESCSVDGHRNPWSPSAPSAVIGLVAGGLSGFAFAGSRSGPTKSAQP